MYSQSMGRVENGRVASYDFSILQIFQEAWAKVSGVKSTIWGALMILIVTHFIVNMMIGVFTGDPLITTGMNNTIHSPTQAVLKFIRAIILAPMFVGYAMIGIKRAVNLPVSAWMVWDYYRYFIKIAGTMLVGTILIAGLFSLAMALLATSMFFTNTIVHVISILAAIALILTSIYFSYCFIFATQIVAEKKLGIWTSLQLSRRAINQHWFKIFFTFLLLFIILIVAAGIFCIGLIWAIPFIVIAHGILYRILFGVEEVRGQRE